MAIFSTGSVSYLVSASLDTLSVHTARYSRYVSKALVLGSVLFASFRGFLRNIARLIGYIDLTIFCVLRRANIGIVYRGLLIGKVGHNICYECLGWGINTVHVIFRRVLGASGLPFGSI